MIGTRVSQHNFFYSFRYMAALEDTMHLPLWGLFLLIFLDICFDAFSAVMVQYSPNHSWRNRKFSYVHRLICSSITEISIINNFLVFFWVVHVRVSLLLKLDTNILKKYNHDAYLCKP